MSSCSDVLDLLDRYLAGDQFAATCFYNRFVKQLICRATRQLGPQLRRRLDPEDVVQSAFRTFFRRIEAGILRARTSDAVVRLLVRITIRKAFARARGHTAAMRDVNAETALGAEGFAEVIGREPGPEETAIFIDEIRFLISDQPPEVGEILRLLLEGYAKKEIAELLDTMPCNVYRSCKLLKERLERYWAPEHEG